MAGFSSSSLDSLDLDIPEYAEQDTFSPSPSPVHALNSRALMRKATSQSQEMEYRACSTLRPRPSFLKCYESMCKPSGHQLINNNDTRSESLLRQRHFKSRKGCHSCKARRVKCPENHPVCSQCTRRRLKCEWPDLCTDQVTDPKKKSPPIPREIELSSPIFTAQDFRLFHHFIQDAYPNKPFGNQSIWAHEIPSISHNYDYLLHAMLALSASDLEASSDGPFPDLTQSAMFHRIIAIKSLNRAISAGMQSSDDGNAILATCFILLYQSTLIADGLPEFLTFVRGCVLVPIQMDCKGLKFLFRNLLSEEEIEMTRPYLRSLPAVDLSPVNAARMSMEAFAPLCERESEKVMHDGMLKIIHSFYISSCDAYLTWLKGSVIFSRNINHAEFLDLIEPSNVVGKLIQSHFVATQTLLPPFIVDERSNRKALQFLNGMVKWLDLLHFNLEPSVRKYFEWPMKRANEIREWLQYERAIALA